ncbi:MAG: phage holin family protein [Nocardioides sp.]|uniref:phage holin family protein n=1 Tax=Nocardioides sp. TaxID=35761 RepID=UPI0039E4C96A
MRFLTLLVTNAIALAVAVWLVPGIWFAGPTGGSEEIKHKIVPLLVVAAIMVFLNYLVKPVLTVLSIPFIIVTLGLFLLVVNAAVLGLAAWISGHTRYGLHVDDFWSAVLGGLIIAIVASVVRRMLEDDR